MRIYLLDKAEQRTTTVLVDITSTMILWKDFADSPWWAVVPAIIEGHEVL